MEDSVAVLPAGSTPTGTCEDMRPCRDMEEDTLHPIRSLKERLDDEVPILLAPSPHLLVGMNNGTDIIHNIFLLSTLVMEGRGETSKAREWTVCQSRVDS